MGDKSVNKISAEALAAYLDGNATAQESLQILNALADDALLRELLHISQLVDTDHGAIPQRCDFIPMTAMAASCNDGNICSLECEKYILQRLNFAFDEEQLLSDAVQNGWLKDKGTALHNVGRHLEGKGLVVVRQYKSTLEDVAEALTSGDSVIVAVDGGELLGCRTAEVREDIFVEPIPDHTVVVLSYAVGDKTITIYDPNSTNVEDVYPIDQFEDAWSDSKNYLVTINFKDMKTYNPKPIDLSDVVLTEDLNELREAIAENAHEVWAVKRQAEGWTYGPHRDDAQKHTPCMVPYSQLPEKEKDYDRDMAMDTLKLMKKLGYDLIKREDTELYKMLKRRIMDADEEFQCAHCKHKVSKHQVYCDNCGHKLNIDWNLYKK